MTPLVYFTRVTPDRPELAAELDWQLETALGSLRSSDWEITIRLYCFGEPSAELAASIRAHGVELVELGDYGEYLARSGHPAHHALRRIPLLHKWLCLGEIDGSPSQVLYLDSDTFFAGPPAALFESCRDADLYAREEPFSRASRVTDARYLDEAALYALAAAESLARVAPFNTGVMVMNHGVWRRMARRADRFLSFVWRFLSWMADRPSEPDLAAARFLRREGRDLLLAAPGPPLEYPSTNRWLIEEHAAWLTLGSIPDLRIGPLPSELALQNGEYLHPAAARGGWTVCHYFGAETRRFARWLGRGEPGAEDPRG